MKSKYIIGYMALLVLPALVIGLLALRWLRHEDERLQALARAALEERAAVMAGHVDLLLQEAIATVHDALARLPEDPEALYRWAQQDPLARHAFVWAPPDQLLLPQAEWAHPAEQAFMRRYEALFSGCRLWPDSFPEEAAQTTAPRAAPADALQTARRELAQRTVRYASETEAYEAAPVVTGVLPWFWERDLHWLLWNRNTRTGTIRGVELEHLAVYARLVPLFQTTGTGQTAFALYDHLDELMVASPEYAALPAAGGRIAVTVGEWLPNWRLYAVETRAAAVFPFGVVAGLLVAILLVTILSGGGWMCRQGWLSHRDALQKTSFVSNVSHELKTPLTTIRMYAEMLKEGRIRDPSKQAGYLRVIESESRRLTRLVNNVLDFSRLEQHRRRYTIERLDLAGLLRDVTAAHADRFEEAGMHVHLAAPETPAMVRAERDALEQVLLNLLDNAAKYAIAGREVHVELARRGDRWCVTVADRGPGIPEEHVERVFASFHRVDDSLTQRVPGAGLGLSIGRRLMRDMGGDLVYRHRKDGGAVFEIHLPGAPPGEVPS